MQNAITLASGYIECLFLVLAIEAVRGGRRLYAGAVLGLAMVLYARVADGFITNTVEVAVIVAGLVLTGLTVVADPLFEVVEEPGEETPPSV